MTKRSSDTVRSERNPGDTISRPLLRREELPHDEAGIRSDYHCATTWAPARRRTGSLSSKPLEIANTIENGIHQFRVHRRVGRAGAGPRQSGSAVRRGSVAAGGADELLD